MNWVFGILIVYLVVSAYLALLKAYPAETLGFTFVWVLVIWVEAIRDNEED